MSSTTNSEATSTPSTPSTGSGNGSGTSGLNVPPQVVSIGLGFIAAAFCTVVAGFSLRMYLARRRAQSEGNPAPPWIDVFFSMVESRNPRGRSATAGFLYFEPGFGMARRGRGEDKNAFADMPIPTLYDCDIEYGTDKTEAEEANYYQLSSSEFQPMTAYSKVGNTTEPVTIQPGTQLNISLLIRMPTAPPQPSAYTDDEPPLPEISVGVLDLYIPTGTTRDSDESWGSKEGKARPEVQHLEYR